MRVRRLLTLLMMITLTIAGGTSVASALCRHQSAQDHAAALHGNDSKAAAIAQLEEMAGAVAAKKSAAVDAASLSLPPFTLPAPANSFDHFVARPAHGRPADAAMLASLSVAPLLEPPAA